MKIFTFLFILLCFVIFTPGCNVQNTKDTNLKTEKEQIKNTLIDMWDAIENEDIDRYASHLHPEFTQFGESDSVLLKGKENEVKATKSWIDDSKNIHTEMIDPQITINGKVAWITYYWSDHGITGGIEFASKGKATRIFVKDTGKWLCIHGHYTLLP